MMTVRRCMGWDMVEWFTRRPRSRDELGDRLRDGSEPRIATVCPPVVEYTREFQARAAEELGWLPVRSAIAEMLVTTASCANRLGRAIRKFMRPSGPTVSGNKEHHHEAGGRRRFR